MKPIWSTGRPARDWSAYNNDLGARFALLAVTDTMDPRAWLTGKHGGNQKMYTDDIIMVLAKLKALLNLPLRGGGLLEDYVRTHRMDVPIPHYFTVCRRVRMLKWLMPRPTSGDWTMDSTGFGVSDADEYFNARFNFDPKTKYKETSCYV